MFEPFLSMTRLRTKYQECHNNAIHEHSLILHTKKQEFVKDELLKLGAQLRRSPYVPLVG